VPSSEFINARFSARRRDTSSSSDRTYFDLTISARNRNMTVLIRVFVDSIRALEPGGT
jgi:hypothetical protein